MKVLLVGVGTVGEAIARLSAGRPWLEQMVLADHDVDRVRGVADSIGDAASHPVEQLDASDARAVEALARAHGVDLVMNAVDPRFVMSVFEGALAADVDYMDMALSLSAPHPTDPYAQPGVKLGDDQFAMDAAWRDKGRLALVGQGVSPGLAQVFAADAAKHHFDEIHDINIRAGGDLRIEGYPFATVFSIWTTIEECLNPPLVWEKERGFFTLPPFSEPERFIFPEGIGPVSCVQVEHEDVAMIPRVMDVRRVTFKFALDEEFMGALKVLHAIGLDRTDEIEVDGQLVRPRNVVAALVPEPATLGDNMTGRVIVGTHVTGLREGKPREIFSYQMCDAQETMRSHGLQPVAWQAGFNPVVAMELLAEGAWQGAGVLSAESFDPDPYLAILDRDGIHHATIDIEPGRAFA
ncbi:MAG TPA: saccharopine dehydrogenase C-terminal domain-containing protein [Candidatus Limnocylindria bacterium]|nr:saccharopine dehydrogenase C-terminal domain-containing protein [Candidatus Limnocylindria bacterium]